MRAEEMPAEIERLRSGAAGDYYQALTLAAGIRLRRLATLHARSQLDGSDGVRRRLVIQQHQTWRQFQWLTAEMHRLDLQQSSAESRSG